MRSQAGTAVLTGCPCGHTDGIDECVVDTPLPVADRGACDGRCGSFDLVDRERWARELGYCPCLVGVKLPVQRRLH